MQRHVVLLQPLFTDVCHVSKNLALPSALEPGNIISFNSCRIYYDDIVPMTALMENIKFPNINQTHRRLYAHLGNPVLAKQTPSHNSLPRNCASIYEMQVLKTLKQNTALVLCIFASASDSALEL